MKFLAGLAFGLLLSLATTAVAAPQADLAIGISSSPASPEPGDRITYTIAVTNYGPAAAANVVTTHTLSPHLIWVSATGGCVGHQSGSIIQCSGALSPGGQVTYTVVTSLSSSASLGDDIVDVASVTSDTPDSNPVNNSASLIRTIGAAVPPPMPVPTLTEWAMILLGGLLAGGAVLQLELRRRAV